VFFTPLLHGVFLSIYRGLKMKGYVTCPDCGSRFPIRLPQKSTKTAEVVCLKCGHGWRYEGSLRSRIHCPKCGSTKNDVNRKIFGKWNLTNLRGKTVKREKRL